MGRTYGFVSTGKLGSLPSVKKTHICLHCETAVFMIWHNSASACQELHRALVSSLTT